MTWRLEDLETPALVVDLDIAEANLSAMQDRATRAGLELWPHTKTHKSPVMARRQAELGAGGLTVAKLEAAAVLREAGLTRLHVAYPLVGDAKAERIADLLRRGTSMRVALDSAEAVGCVADGARRAGARVEILIEVDVGMRRVGAPPGEPVVALAQLVDRTDHLEFAGLESYAGHIGQAPDEASRTEVLRAEAEALAQTRLLLERAGLAPRVVSVGGTHHAARMEKLFGATEVRPGTYVYNDRATLLAGSCTEADLAASVVVTVVSKSPDHAAVDGGSKAFSSDAHRLGGFGLVRGHDTWRLSGLSEEHGILEWPDGEEGPRIGDRLAIVPNHVCTAVNLHGRAYGVRGGEVAQVLAIAGRGRLR